MFPFYRRCPMSRCIQDRCVQGLATCSPPGSNALAMSLFDIFPPMQVSRSLKDLRCAGRGRVKCVVVDMAVSMLVGLNRATTWA